MQVYATVQVALTAVVLLRMLVVGFLQPPGRVFSWPMFTRGCAIDVDLEGRRGDVTEEINVFDVLPPHHPAMTVPDLQLALDYLSERYDDVSGHGTVYCGAGNLDLAVRDAHVAV